MEPTLKIPGDAEANNKEADPVRPGETSRNSATESPPSFLPDTKAPPGADVADEESAQSEESDSTTHWNL